MKYIPPWKEPYFIGVAGSSGSGKTSITTELIRRLNAPWSVLLSMDNFYQQLNDVERQRAYESNFDFDAPAAIDFDLLLEVLQDLKAGRKTDVPIYSFNTHSRTDQSITIYGANIVIIEGIYALFDPRVLDLLDLKIFVQEDLDVCMARRLHRDILYRGRELKLSIKQWDRYVKPNYLAHIAPTAKGADMLIPHGVENKVAIRMLLSHLRQRLEVKSQQHLHDLVKLGNDGNAGPPLEQVALILPPSHQVRGIHTILLDRETSRDDFVFYFNRIADMLITFALGKAFEENSPAKEVETPVGSKFMGVRLPFDKVCAVTMIRGGECFETALKASVPTILLGRLLIQSDSVTGEPKLHTRRLPPAIDGPREQGVVDYKVFITDTQILSGAAAVMAIAVLVDHGIRQQDITYIAYISSEIGLRRIHAAFPDVTLVVGKLSPTVVILDLDARYYGT